MAYIIAYDKYPLEKRTHFMRKKYDDAHNLVQTLTGIEYDTDPPVKAQS